MLPSRVEIGPSVIFQQMNQELVLLNMANQQYFGLNETGARIWELLVSMGHPGDVAEKMASDFSMPRALVEQDMERLLKELDEAGLIVVDWPA